VIKHRAATRMCWPHQGWIIDILDERYVFGHPVWWERKGFLPDCHIDHNISDRSLMAEKMREIFWERVADYIVWPSSTLIAEQILAASKAAEKSRVQEAAGVMELFG